MRWAAAVVASLALLAASCSDGGDTSETESPAGDTTPTQQETDGEDAGDDQSAEGPVTVAVANFPGSGVPWVQVGSPGQYVWSAIFDALTVIGADGEPQPALAESWESVDETTWRFNLRQGVEFHNGEPFTAEAVTSTFDLLMSEEGSSKYPAHVRNYGDIESVTATDDSTIEIVTASPNPLLPNEISIVYIVPPQYWQEVGEETFATEPVGTGPYEVTTWDTQTIRLEQAENSWRQTQVPVIEYVVINDPAARVQALQSGQAQIIQSVSPDQLPTLEEEGFTSYVAPSGRLMSLVFISNKGGPLAEQAVRQALNYAVDKEAIANELLHGLTQPTAWPPEGVNGYDPEREPYPYDPEQARQLLEEAGHGDGFDMMAEVTLGAFPADREIYEATAGYLSEIGVNLELQEIDFAQEWLPKFTGSDGADWSGEAFGGTWVSPPLMDAIRPFAWNSCGWVNEWFCDEQAEELVNEVNSTFDVEQRNETLHQLLDRNMDNPPALFLIELVEFWAHAPEVTGWETHAFNPTYGELAVSGG